jgi:glutamine synthetase
VPGGFATLNTWIDHQKKTMNTVKRATDGALDCLEKAHEVLLKGDVFTPEFLEMSVSHQRQKHDALRLRPHPRNFFPYCGA